jgi:hypothetical protein
MDIPQELAVLLPLTSRGSTTEDIASALGRFFSSLVSGFDRESAQLAIYVGVDAGDHFYAPEGAEFYATANAEVEVGADAVPSASEGLGILQRAFNEVVRPACSARLSVQVFNEEPGRVCAIWRHLAQRAHDDGSTLMVLFGDDVVIDTPGWLSRVLSGFDAVHARHPALPWGFGCVALHDVTHPGFPTFPVIHRTHMEIFEGEIFSDRFYNQDADPFLFEVYRRFSASVFAEGAELRNLVGGGVHEATTRYNKRHNNDWQFLEVPPAVERVRRWLRETGRALAFDTVVLDVAIATYRVDLQALAHLLSTWVPAHTDTRFVVVIDDPTKACAIAALRQWVAARGNPERYRVLVNNQNLGASPTRNRGILEAWGDWVLMLDDDVAPHPGFLQAYSDGIRAYPDAGALVGCTSLASADPTNAFAVATTLLRVTEFWEIARELERPAWGVTANIALRRIRGQLFRETLTAGEEIDYCLRLRKEHGLGVVAVPKAVADHPWWDDGARHLAQWAYGDGELMDHHPEHCYHDWPDTAELGLACAVVAATSLLCLGQPAVAAAAIVAAVVFAVVELLLLMVDFMPVLAALDHVDARLRARVVWQMFEILMRSNWGRLRGHMARRGVWAVEHLCRRFDWSCGSKSGFVGNMRRASQKRFATQVTVLAVVAGLEPLATGLVVAVAVLAMMVAVSLVGESVSPSPATPRSFVVLFEGKEGSSVVLDVLRRLRDVRVLGFEPLDSYRFTEIRHGGRSRDMPTDDLLRCIELVCDQAIDADAASSELEGIYSRYSTESVTRYPDGSVPPCPDVLDRGCSVGFKMRLRRKRNHAALFELWKRTGTVVFVMYREDTMRWALSKSRRGNTQFGLAAGTVTRDQLNKLTIDVAKLRGVIEQCNALLCEKDALVHDLRGRGVTAYPLRYELFLHDPEACVLQLLGQLGVDVERARADVHAAVGTPGYFQKVHSNRLLDVVANVDDLRGAFPCCF